MGEQTRRANQEVANVRSALEEFYYQRERRKVQSPGHHLHVSSLNMGCPNFNLKTQQQRTLELPISMCVDPKWSSQLKRMNDKIGERLNWEKKISAAITGSVCPERYFMPPQT